MLLYIRYRTSKTWKNTDISEITSKNVKSLLYGIWNKSVFIQSCYDFFGISESRIVTTLPEILKERVPLCQTASEKKLWRNCRAISKVPKQKSVPVGH